MAANLTRRYTEEGLDVWSGPLSNGRTVVALVNWNNKVVTGTLNLPDIGIQSASTLYDVWAATSRTNVKTSYTASIAAHGTALLELGGTTVAGDYYADLFATTSG